MFVSRRGSDCFNRGCDPGSWPRIGAEPRRVAEHVVKSGFAGGIRSLRLTAIVTLSAPHTARQSLSFLACWHGRRLRRAAIFSFSLFVPPNSVINPRGGAVEIACRAQFLRASMSSDLVHPVGRAKKLSPARYFD